MHDKKNRRLSRRDILGALTAVGGASQLATMSGSAASGYTASLQLGI